jgi:hypothetical protein
MPFPLCPCINCLQAGDVDTGFIIKHAEELKEPPPVPKVRVTRVQAA